MACYCKYCCLYHFNHYTNCVMCYSNLRIQNLQLLIFIKLVYRLYHSLFYILMLMSFINRVLASNMVLLSPYYWWVDTLWLLVMILSTVSLSCVDTSSSSGNPGIRRPVLLVRSASQMTYTVLLLHTYEDINLEYIYKFAMQSGIADVYKRQKQSVAEH